MRKHFRLTISSLLITLLAIFTLAFAGSAYAAPTKAGAIPNSGAPIVHIVQTHKKANFNPHTLQLNLQHSPFMSWTNDTNATQVVLDANNHPDVTVMAHQSQIQKFTKTGTYVYHLKSNPNAKVTITVS